MCFRIGNAPTAEPKFREDESLHLQKGKHIPKKCFVLVFSILFLIMESASEAQTPTFQTRKSEDFVIRDGIGNTMAKLRAGDEVRVAYLGGSITETHDGWRPQTTAMLSKKWPKTSIVEINAAIGATGSEIGVYRMERDVLKYAPDLLFVEFAVNDGGCSPENIWKP